MGADPLTPADIGAYSTAAVDAALATKASKDANLSDLADAAAARTNLGLGAASSPTFAGLTDSALTPGRVPYAGDGGLLVDSANLTFGTYTGPYGTSYLSLNNCAGLAFSEVWSITPISGNGNLIVHRDSGVGYLYLDWVHITGSFRSDVPYSGKTAYTEAADGNMERIGVSTLITSYKGGLNDPTTNQIASSAATPTPARTPITRSGRCTTTRPTPQPARSFWAPTISRRSSALPCPGASIATARTWSSTRRPAAGRSSWGRSTSNNNFAAENECFGQQSPSPTSSPCPPNSGQRCR